MRPTITTSARSAQPPVALGQVIGGWVAQIDFVGHDIGIVKNAVVEPLRWIAENGGKPGYVIVSKVAEMGDDEGYNAKDDTYGNLLEQGVIDPVKVTRSALANAASIAGLLLTTETLVVTKQEEADED